MTTYKVSDLLNVVQRMADAGYEYVKIDEYDPFFEEDDDSLKSLDFGAVLNRESSEGFEVLFAIEVPEDYQFEPEP